MLISFQFRVSVNEGSAERLLKRGAIVRCEDKPGDVCNLPASFHLNTARRLRVSDIVHVLSMVADECDHVAPIPWAEAKRAQRAKLIERAVRLATNAPERLGIAAHAAEPNVETKLYGRFDRCHVCAVHTKAIRARFRELAG